MGEKKTLKYIKSNLEISGIPYIENDFSSMESGHSFSRSIEVTLKGEKPDTIIIAVPLNHPENVAEEEDGSINPALLLGLINKYNNIKLPVTIKFLILGSEFGTDSIYPIGTNQFLNTFYPEYPVIALYLNFKNIPSEILMNKGGINGIITPYWLTQRCSLSLDKNNIPYLSRGNENQIYRLGLNDNPTSIAPYLLKGYPSINLEGLYDSPIMAKNQWISSFLLFCDDFIAQNKNGFPEEWDRHYLSFQIGKSSLIIDEKTYILIFISVLSAALIYITIFKKNFIRYIRTLYKNIWVLPVLFLIIFIFLLFGTFIVSGLCTARDFPSLWENLPFLFFFLKISSALFFYSLMFRFLQNLPFPKSSSFYSSVSIFFFLLDIAIISFIDISFTYYFLWAFLFSFLFSVFPNKHLKLISLLLSTVLIIIGTYDVFTLPAMKIINIFILSKFKGNVLISFMLLPFMFMLIRLDFLYRHPGKGRQKLILRGTYTLLGTITAILLIFLFTASPYNENNPQPIKIIDNIDLDTGKSTLKISSTAPLGKLNITASGKHFKIDSKLREYSVTDEKALDILKLESKKNIFLDRQHITLNLLSKSSPHKIELLLKSKDSIIIFDSNFPYSVDKTGNTAIIHIGINPPNPILIDFIIPETLDYKAYLKTSYKEIPFELNITGKNINVSKEMIVNARL